MGLKPGIAVSIALLTSGLVLAQDSKSDDTKDQKATDPQEQEQAYEGPSILSRDRNSIGERGGKLIDFKFYGEITGIYDTGLTPFALNSAGNLVNIGANYGMEVGGGVIGSRRWKRDKLNVDYHGGYRQYTPNNASGGVDQFLNLDYTHVLTRRMTLQLKETAGTSALANGAFSYLPLNTTDLFAVPANELFDSRTNFLHSGVDFVWQKSARLSFGLGGDGFIVRRSILELAGLNGYSLRANVAYRITRRQTLSANYGYTSYDFQRQFGDSRLHVAQLGYSLGLSRRWDFGVNLGAMRIESLGINQVNVDPAIAAIIGTNTVFQTFHRIVYAPATDIRITRRFDRSSLAAGFSEGASPGDGVYLTSKQSSATLGYSYTGYRRFTTGLNAAYTELSTVGQTLGKYTNVDGGIGGTYRLASGTHIELRYDYRHYTTQNSIYQKDSQRVSLGLAFSPGSTPLAIW